MNMVVNIYPREEKFIAIDSSFSNARLAKKQQCSERNRWFPEPHGNEDYMNQLQRFIL